MFLQLSKISNTMRYISFALCVFCLIHCKSKDVMPQNTELHHSDSLHFGSGGGFTGKVTSYILNSKGQISNSMAKKLLNTISEQEVEQVFKNYETLGFGEMTMEQPGNLYYFVEREMNGQKHRLTWGAHDFKEPKELKIFHANLMRFTRPKKDVQPDKSDYPIK